MRFSPLLFVFALLLIPGQSQAETLAEAVEKCRLVSNSLKRLVCYDQLAQRANTLEDSDLAELYNNRPVYREVQVPVDGQRPAPAPQARDPESSFGLELEIQREAKRKSEKEVSEITAVVGKVEESLRGKLIITLADGQVWRQTDNEDLKIKAGQTVTISRGMLGAFYLKKQGTNSRIRVKRES